MSRNKREPEGVPGSEVVPTAKGRPFSSWERLCMLEESDTCKHAKISAPVRKAGTYPWYLSRWRGEPDWGQLEVLGPGKRRRASKPD